MFSRTDTTTDSERFYNSVLELFDDDKEKEEVEDLLVWWNRYVRLVSPGPMLFNRILRHIFPNYSSAQRPVAKNSALAKIKEKRAQRRAGGAASSVINNPDGAGPRPVSQSLPGTT